MFGGTRPTPFTRKGAFDPHDTRHVKHTRLGVWDIYEETPQKLNYVPGDSLVEQYAEVVKCLPYVWRMVKDVFSIPLCIVLLAAFFLAELGRALMPALTLWYVPMQTAMETRTVDRDRLLHICAGRAGCALSTHLVELSRNRVQASLAWRIRVWYDAHLFRARARLDVPTAETTAIQRQLDDVTPSTNKPPVAWETIELIIGLARTGTQVLSQVYVLGRTLSGQRDGWLLATLTLTSQSMHWFSITGFTTKRPQVWAATTTNQDYIKLHGWQRTVNETSHRKELVAGNLAEYAIAQCERALSRVGNADGDFTQWRQHGTLRNRFYVWSLLKFPLRELPQIFFTLRAVQYPAGMPVSLASLQMVQETTNTFAFNIFELLHSSNTFATQLGEVRKLYEVVNVPNKLVDGTVPFPEESAQIRDGIALEFKNVSFKYSGAENWALRNVSFTVLPGQLCVIVGANGSGKSTVLKLIVRLYDPDEGQVLLGGHDIRTLKLRDLRQAISVLFQDYTLFPLSIRDNIAIGDPSAAENEEHVQRAAALGGADAFIDKLPDGLDTYLDRPVRDHYAGLPEGTATLFGRKVDYSAVRGAGGMKATAASALSGGQLQRLAVARSFMRSVVPEDAKVGLLLFDEPSASLDPVAEHDLFDRLRALRGTKTMLFSSHRFGNLTRHADLILYMNDSVVVEAGSHEQLLQRDGGYANIWKLQAEAFLS
ncbi:P-loop containing nucleoside triphosphate hydrolase protein [Trametes elegans]|nr:P-loop containing nucleoside triphosphate hydrolase protein [Trametes elegans]